MPRNRGEDISLGFSYEHFKHGAHACLIYRDESEKRRVISKYIESGIANNEQIGYFVDTMTPEEVRAWLAELDVELPQTRQVEISPAVSVYCPDGQFVPEQMLSRLKNHYDHAIAAGFSGSRLSGEMTWSCRNIPGSDQLIVYEALINTILDTHPITVVCQYDVNKFDGGLIYDVLQVHPFMFVHGQIVKNPAYIRPEEFFHNRMNTIKNE
ncbi:MULTISPECIES: MEDS domain-containing protein [unclassified Legionella]|uniref:MEDS domain-containing protein n=1 Tax=unclassified Legionella TaxID=2622702 RepID=UPI001E57C04F|nr:MEDS domain-containing protein [Legionella sp. 31fI33]MCC5013798.1 MEDS domain-containing protein [Legionella sp. 31fI33]